MTTFASRTGRTGALVVPVRPGLRRSQRRRLLTALAMLAPALLGLGLFFGYPLVATVYFSFTRFDLVSAPQWIGVCSNPGKSCLRAPRSISASMAPVRLPAACLRWQTTAR